MKVKYLTPDEFHNFPIKLNATGEIIKFFPEFALVCNDVTNKLHHVRYNYLEKIDE